MISTAAQEIRDTLVREQLDNTSIETKRDQWESSSRMLATPPGVTLQSLDVGGVTCLLSVPYDQTSQKTIVYCHGGGLVEGSVETFRVWTSRLALHTGCKVLSIGYRLAPEYPYPAAVEDVIQVCSALSDMSQYPGEICIGADSSGCILGLSILLNLYPTMGNKIDSAFFLSPSIDLTFGGNSCLKNKFKDPLLSIDVLKYYARLYAKNKNPQDPEISPLFADFSHMPPFLVMVDEHEILLDDSIRLVQKLRSAGNTAQLCISQGLWHVWPCWGEFPESTKALETIRQHILNPALTHKRIQTGF